MDEIPMVFSVGKKSISVEAKRRFEVIYYDPDLFYIPWSTSAFPESQADYLLEITSFEEIETINQDYKLYKFTAHFNCKVYQRWGSYKQIDDGFFIGYVDTKLPE